MTARLRKVCELAETGERRQAAQLLRECRAMAEADPVCARVLKKASDRLPDDLGDGGSWLAWRPWK